MNKYAILERELSQRNQFEDNLLTREIMSISGCTKRRAFQIQDGLCNILSLWGILFAQNLIKMTFGEFYKYLLTHEISPGVPFCEVEGWLKIEKEHLFQILGINAQIIKYKTIPEDRQPGECYQVAINGKHHFIAAIVNNDLSVDIFDTGKRGCPVEIGRGFARNHDKPDWFKFIG